MSPTNTESYQLKAPVDGLVVAIGDVPDPVFAQETLGPGIAIEPLGDTLCAPADGKVIQCAPTRHSVTLELAAGVEILLHLGLDTVKLNGDGLELLVRVGEQVKAGTPLIRFDVDKVARGATSLATPLVSIGEKKFQILALAKGQVAAGAPFAELSPAGVQKADGGTAAAGETTVEETARIALENGLHARPASRLKIIGDTYNTKIVIRHNGNQAEASRITSLLNLGLMHNDTITLLATGPQAKDALAEAKKLLETPEGVEITAPSAPASNKQQDIKQGRLHGAVASPGQALGILQHFITTLPDIEEKGKDTETEKENFLHALRSLQTALENAAQKSSHGSQADILAAHHALLDDDELIIGTLEQIQAGKSAAFAWKATLDERIAALARSANPLIRERTSDLRDLQIQLISLLADNPARISEISHTLTGAIVAADDLTPSQMIALAAVKPAGICLAAGGTTSHVAILCRSAGIPCLMGMGESIIDPSLFDNRTVILDAAKGIVELTPDKQRISDMQEHIRQGQKFAEQAREQAQRPAITKDGATIAVAANIASGAEAEHGFAQGADAVGLFRSEFLFLDRDAAPSAEEQREQYQAAVDAMQGKPVVIRTLDIGADKQLSWLKISNSPNPALGIRGVRLTLTNPELMEAQLSALLQVRAKPLENGKSALQIMVPMVSDITDFAAIRTMVENLAARLKLYDNKGFLMPQLGAMLEVPSAALMTETLAEVADFFSIGTNDLAQYTLAMDREETKLGHRLDVLHPAVLRLVAIACRGAAKHKRPVAVCGAAAGDAIAGLVLAALGVDELSVEPQRIAATKASLRKTNLKALRKEIEKTLSFKNADDVRKALGSYLEAKEIL